jgi:hypothetical protein
VDEVVGDVDAVERLAQVQALDHVALDHPHALGELRPGGVAHEAADLVALLEEHREEGPADVAGRPP